MVASDSAPSDSLPPVFRVSDEERNEVIRMLRDGSVDGRISNETFLQRVDRALHAQGADELAELRRTEEAWMLVDLGSTNGTRVYGWRADSGFTVRAGDWVSFGRAAFRITDHG